MGRRKGVCYKPVSSLLPLDKCPGSHSTPFLFRLWRRLNLPPSWILGRECIAQAYLIVIIPTPLATGVSSEEHTGVIQATEELGEAGKDLPLFRESFQSQPSLARPRLRE